MLRNLFIGAIVACMFIGAAYAETETAPAGVNAYGYTFDDVAVNQGVVLYWYAHGYANSYGAFPETFAAMVEKGMPLRTFVSPFTGDDINPDDGSLDFDGDMMYVPGDCWDVEVHVQTTAGVVILPTTLTGNSDLVVQFDEYCAPCNLCGDCCDITICGIDCWKVDPCDPNAAICKVVQWMMWNSFELHQCLYGTRPVSEIAWIASGLAPVDQNYKEYVPTMDIEYIYKGDACCKILKKAYVQCCAPCAPCEPKCKQDTCSPCKPKCEEPCKPKCDPCKPKCEKACKPKCDPCKPKCEKACKPKCDPCKPKCDPCKPKCDPCKPKCDPCKPKCDPCKPKCEKACKPKCDPCKPKCEKACKPKCDPCKPKCDPCKPKCDDPCNKCKLDTCTPKDKCGKC